MFDVLLLVLWGFWVPYSCWDAVGGIAACITAITAIVGVILGMWQLGAIRKQQRFHTYLNLIDELSAPDSRAARREVHNAAKSYTKGEEATEGGRCRQVRRDTNEKIDPKLVDSIDLVVNQLGKVGFFMKRICGLSEEAPDWLWEIAAGMWDRVGAYVKERGRDGGKPYRLLYGTYFEELAKMARGRYPFSDTADSQVTKEE
ncbi:MAG: hypothetical protein JW846_05185 [Dehalococcoidia bacterium]|nr:hypothetical protein [Dehalococcoidia bacterium]